jgi:hypothetical protein
MLLTRTDAGVGVVDVLAMAVERYGEIRTEPSVVL